MRDSATDLPMILDRVSVTVDNTFLLKDISVEFSAGGPSVLIGPNGSGKTTLLRLLMGLLTPSAGTILWNGRATSSLHGKAIVFQRPVMLRRSVAANISYAFTSKPARNTDRGRRIAELLDRVGLGTMAGRPARTLSGGEQQRLAIARALAREPGILFLDEPTAALDPYSTKTIEDIIQDEARRGVKIVMSTHDLGEARRLAQDIVLLNSGRIVEAGRADAFFNQPATDLGRKFLAGDLLL